MGTICAKSEEPVVHKNAGKKSDADKEIDNQKNYTENNDTKSSNDNDKN